MTAHKHHSHLYHTQTHLSTVLLPVENINVNTSSAVGTAHTHSYQLWRAGHILHFNLPKMTMLLLRQSFSLSLSLFLSMPFLTNLVYLIEFLQQQNPNNSQITRYSHLHFICLFLGKFRKFVWPKFLVVLAM